MKSVIRLVITSFIIGMLVSPLPVGATATQINWGTSTGSSYYTPGSAGATGATLVNTGPYSVDWSTAAPVLQTGGQSFIGPILTSTGCAITATTAVSTPTALSSFVYSSFPIGGTGGPTLPANFLQAGKRIGFHMGGTLSTPGLNVSSLGIGVLLGTSTIAMSGGIPTPIGIASMSFTLDGALTCISSGTFVINAGFATSSFDMRIASGTTQVIAPSFDIGNSTNISSGVNTTVANDFNITFKFTNASAGNVLIINDIIYRLEN